MKRILLISRFPEDLAFVGSLAKASGMKLENRASIEEAKAIYESGPIYSTFVDVSRDSTVTELEEIVGKTCGIFSPQSNPNRFHFLTTSASHSLTFTNSPIFGNVILRGSILGGSNGAEEFGRQYAQMIGAFNQGKPADVTEFLSQRSTSETFFLQSSDPTNEMTARLKRIFLQLDLDSPMRELITLAFDEVLSNAIFDAPVDELGQRIYSAPILKPFPLSGKNAVEVKIVFNRDWIGMTAIDMYGSLERESFLRHLVQAQTLEYDPDGKYCGTGLMSIFKLGATLIFSVLPGQRTQVTVLLRLTSNLLQLKEKYRFLSLHFCQVPKTRPNIQSRRNKNVK